MTRHRFIQLFAVTACAIVLAGCAKKEADEAETKPPAKPSEEHKNILELSEESRKGAHIEAIAVTRTNMNIPLRVPGRISFNLNHTAKVSSTFEGRIVKMNFDVGAVVKQGDVVALIDSPELLKPLELKSPIDGTIIERQGTVGEMLEKAKPFYTISDPSSVWCIAAINEKDSAAVHTGQPATVRVLAHPKEMFQGKVMLPGEAVNETTRTLEARIEVDNSSGKLKPGMFATVSLPTDKLENQLLIPDDAVQNIRGATCVFVEEQPGKYRLVVISIGQQLDGHAQVMDGLTDGARVVTSGSFVLKSVFLKASMEEKG